MSREDFYRNKSKGLCFDENEFLKDSFSVDIFLREHRNKASLEIMRDDLGTHLKTLRMSMIELINKDYEDFVNLSRDLVGLDNEILKIQIPLKEIKSQIMGVKSDLEEAISGFNSCLEKHKQINDKKRSLIYLSQVITCIDKLKSIIVLSSNQKDISLDFIERATMECNQLLFSVSKCKKDLPESKKNEAEDVKQKLMNILSKKFFDCLKSENSRDLIKCLRIYAALDKIKNLEALVRQQIIAPKLSELINETTLQKEPNGVEYIYNEIIKFIESDLIKLFNLTTYRETPPQVRGYNFLINSLWPELEKQLDLPLMFAPGNPKLFHSRFTKSVELVRKLEIMCGNRSMVLRLRQHEQYIHFFQKWNLPVYFKIRFQEIAGQLEKVLMEEEIQSGIGSVKNEESYALKSSFIAMEQIKKCWRNDIYLSELSHLFWKLSLQILSRYTVWIEELLSKQMEVQEKKKIEFATFQSSSGMENSHTQSRLDFLVCLFNDTNKLITESRTFLEICKDKIPDRHLIEEELSVSLKEAFVFVEESLPKITKLIVKVIVSESAIHFRQVSQIPRLFRRTNRKSSTEPCEYVGNALNLPKQFYEWKKDSVSDSVLESWLTFIFNELTVIFYDAINEVLTNAQKTEESLRKLKKKRENYSTKNSGDDEIRQQLVIDVHSFCDGAEGIRVRRDNVKMLRKLVELVETARDRSEKQ